MFEFFKRSLRETKPTRDAIRIERVMVQIEICHEFGKFEKMHQLMLQCEELTNSFLDEHDWPEEALDSFLMGRKKIKWLHDPSYQSRMQQDLRDWQRKNGRAG